MTLRQKQSHFVLMVAALVSFANMRGYDLTYADAYADPNFDKIHKKNSNHHIRLAVDFNLFKDGKYLTKTQDYKPLGEFWESIGGSWGGRFSKGDGNHFSLEHEGRR